MCWFGVKIELIVIVAVAELTQLHYWLQQMQHGALCYYALAARYSKQKTKLCQCTQQGPALVE